MEEHSLKVITAVGDNELLDKNNSPVTTSKVGLRNNLQISVNLHEDSDEDDTDLVMRMKKRVRQFSDSDSDEENKRSHKDNLLLHFGEKDHSIVSKVVETGSESGSDNDIFNKSKNTRILKVSKDSESDSDTDTFLSFKNKAQQPHKNKRINLKQKFKNFNNHRSNESDSQSIPELTKDKQSQSSDDSNDEEASITEIKKKIKERISSLKSTICDPDTSSDEESSQQKQPPRPTKERRSIKLTSPKPARMSAKQAMENMQKIKSESNRMLREQQVSLPYHRPKALSLKDIINRRKPALSSDGKALPIKMNEEQLKQYVLQLEQRQKEIMELCKSESDEEEPQLNDDKIEDLQSKLNTCDNVTETNKANIESDNVETDVNYTNKEHINKLGKEDIERNEYSKDINMADNKSTEQSKQPNGVDNIKENELLEEQDPSIELVYNNSTENDSTTAVCENIMSIKHDSKNIASDCHPDNESCSVDTENDSQLISLHLDTEQIDSEINQNSTEEKQIATTSMLQSNVEMDVGEQIQDSFLDDDINMDEIDTIIENAEIIKSGNLENFNNSPMLIRDPQPFKSNPRLTGAPGMVIDLDGGDPFQSKKLTGVELLKERFTYFAALKTPDEMERHRDQKSKPGTLHLKLKQDLEEQIAKQRSLEWAKRLEKEKEQQMELNALRGDASEEEADIDKIESKLEEDNIAPAESSSESEEELLEDDICMKDKPRVKNPMVAYEAEESDCDEGVATNATGNDDVSADENVAADDSDKNESNDESSEEESSESEDEQTRPKKGRILKAFEDSDDEDETIKLNDQESVTDSAKVCKPNEEDNITEKQGNEVIKDSQDDELQLAQRHKSSSWELFTSQDSVLMTPTKRITPKDTDNNVDDDDKDLGTQTFSILNSGILVDSEIKQHCTEKLSDVCTTQPFEENLDAVAAMCSGSFTQNLVNTQLPITQASQSQPIGEDILALCTGQFYDNQFVSPADENMSTEITQESLFDDNYYEDTPKESAKPIQHINNQEESKKDKNEPDISLKNSKEKEGNLLKSILDELDDPDFDSPKVNKFFNGNSQIKDKDQNIQSKKKFIIDSDDETNEATDSNVKKQKLKKKKLENRALQISDDEEDETELEDEEESYMSEIEDDTNRIVEYDSEENEVEINPQNLKKKRKGTDFFEQEAELTSEDEWVGSGDEDEADLDRMEREEGDDDTFHQGKLQRELGQIHLRDVLDQDKREVRIIQELLFEDGDLGEGHRQRKFRWRNADGEEETGTTPDEFADTQEEEFESEEQWRKERHEREIFLRQLKDPDEAEENPNNSVNRTTIIKANLSSKSMSSLLMEVNNSVSKSESPVVAEKIAVKDIPSPKKPFTIFKQNYHGSLLTRGRGALARLAALATPLAVDEDAPKVGSLAPTNRRNFVFTALTPDDENPKITKRKADVNVNTPRLVKKMKTEEKQKYSKSLLEQLNV